MSSQRVCQIFPIPSDRIARAKFGQELDIGEGVLGCLNRPSQAIFAGLPSTNASEICQDISSSLTTVFFVGPVADAEAALEQWAKDCFGALNQGLDPSDSDGAVLGLWQHPEKDLAMVGVLCSGDWAADLAGNLTDQGDELIQLAYSGNDNEPVVFLPDFITDNPDLDEQLVYDIVETVLLTVNDEWIGETQEALVEVEAQDLVERYKAKYS